MRCRLGGRPWRSRVVAGRVSLPIQAVHRLVRDRRPHSAMTRWPRAPSGAATAAGGRQRGGAHVAAMLKRVGLGALALLLLAAAAAGAGFLWMRGSLPVIDGERAVSGLAAPVEIVRDRHGVPHVLAASEEDALFALGYVHAQDRLWQMEMNRRIGAGRLAEVLGPAAPRHGSAVAGARALPAGGSDAATHLEPGAQTPHRGLRRRPSMPGWRRGRVRCPRSSCSSVSNPSRGARPIPWSGQR